MHEYVRAGDANLDKGDVISVDVDGDSYELEVAYKPIVNIKQERVSIHLLDDDCRVWNYGIPIDTELCVLSRYERGDGNGQQ